MPICRVLPTSKTHSNVHTHTLSKSRVTWTKFNVYFNLCIDPVVVNVVRSFARSLASIIKHLSAYTALPKHNWEIRQGWRGRNERINIILSCVPLTNRAFYIPLCSLNHTFFCDGAAAVAAAPATVDDAERSVLTVIIVMEQTNQFNGSHSQLNTRQVDL